MGTSGSPHSVTAVYGGKGNFAGSGIPTGSITFTDNGQLIPYGPLGGVPLVSASARCTVTYAAAGAHAIVASYSGDTNFVGSNATLALQTRRDGKGYWLASGEGGVFSYGDARDYGSAVGMSGAPIVGIAATSDGKGYWLVASDGGVFNFGDAASSARPALACETRPWSVWAERRGPPEPEVTTPHALVAARRRLS